MNDTCSKYLYHEMNPDLYVIALSCLKLLMYMYPSDVHVPISNIMSVLINLMKHVVNI